MSFLDNLSDSIQQTFEVGENKLHTLDINENGGTRRFDKLGDFANKFDQSATRSYTEAGYFRTDPYNPKPQQLDILMQEPDITVLVKKRMFSSLAENYRTDLMDEHEKLFVRATKVLFQAKCQQISALEKLSKINQIATEIGSLDGHLLPIVFSATDALFGLASFANSPINPSLLKFKNVVDRLREVAAFSKDSIYTTWLTNVPDSLRSTLGEGTGVIEFTNVTSLSTSTTISRLGGGTFQLNFADPYEVMLVTNNDIEAAISDATNRIYANSFTQLGVQSLNDTIALKKNQLNQIRAVRGANPIIFLVEPDTVLGKRVRAIIDVLGFEINFDASAISNVIGTANIDPSALFGQAAGNDGLTNDEVSVFNDIVSSLYTQISLTVNSRRQAKIDNQDPKNSLNSLRKKLRLHFGNKLVIQPMDNVHIYIQSKKKIDSKITGGLQSNFSSLGFMQGLNNLTQDIKDSFDVYRGTSIEKSVFVGDDFPNWLWLILRNQFVSDKNGAHVFAGVVKNASSSYNNGVFTVNASGGDNADYFHYGVVNFNPSIDVFNGPLHDPLTPFKLEFDAITGVQKKKPGEDSSTPELLDENKGLFDSAFVKNKSGLLTGIKPSENSYFLSGDADRTQGNGVRRVFYDPDGMVYRWKEGIATLVLFGDSYDPTAKSVYNQAPAITSDPFAGQDIMNVLSLLISGEPYNFATFYKTAIQFDNYKRDNLTGELPANSYYRGLQTQLKYRNKIYGNFVPFKKLTMDDASWVKILNGQLTALNYDNELQQLLEQRANLADKLAVFAHGAGSPSDISTADILKNIDTQISSKIKDIEAELNKIDKKITIVGNDISVDYSTDDTQSMDKTRLDQSSRKELQRKLNYLTRRLAWKTRANEDPNYLIVDDTYDKDLDIQAFEKTFTNMSLFDNKYVTVGDNIDHVAQLLNLEVFANTQGHIEVRNPKYNRIPSSVFFKMLRLKDELGIQLFPQFMEDLFTNQFEQLKETIEVLEDEIRLLCLALGKLNDSDCVSFINDSKKLYVSSYLFGTASFRFLSDEGTGKINDPLSGLEQAANPEELLQIIQQNFDLQTSVSAFDIGARASISRPNNLPGIGSNNPNQFDNLSTIRNRAGESTREQDLKGRLFSKTGQTFDLNQKIANTNQTSNTEVLHLANDIGDRLAERQRAIKTAASALKNIQESASLAKGNGANNPLGNRLLLPGLYGNNSIPQVFEHMIEDESYDDLGVGSGGRYIIKNHDIISYDIAENKPDFNAIEVTGRLDLFIKNSDLPQGLKVFQNGNAMVTATAIDYDMWRMYGLHNPQPLDAPFLSDPNTQCAPYAVSVLNRARRNILRGTMTIVGNEYQQPGEVVYIEPRDLLFYVETVSHSFTFGSNFQTRLELTYGHNPGEFIPTPYDVIGRVLYRNKDIVQHVNKRQGHSFNQEHLGAIIGNVSTNPFDLSSLSNDVISDICSGPYGESNRASLQRIIEQAAPALGLFTAGTKPILEIRVYFNSSTGDFSSPSTYAISVGDAVFDFLVGKSDMNGLMTIKPKGQSTTNLAAFGPTGSDQIKRKKIDASPTIPEFRYPSAKAFGLARDATTKSSSDLEGSALQQAVDAVVYGFIVDCWVIFTPNTSQ